MRDFRNPDFLQKMVDYFHIDHTGTCFAPGAWDPKSLRAEDFYDRCAGQPLCGPRQELPRVGAGGPGAVRGAAHRSVRSCCGWKLIRRASASRAPAHTEQPAALLRLAPHRDTLY